MPDQINKVSVEGVTYQITPSDTGTFTGTSNDASSPSSWTSVALLVSGETNGSIFTKISSMFKNIRYLYDKLGGSDLDQSSGSIIQQLGELYSGKADINHTHNTATTAAAGFMPVLDGDSTKCLLGDGSWGSAGSTYATVSTAAPGLAPTLSGETTEFLRGDGTWASAGSTYATVSTAAPGLAPTLSGSTTQFLRGDGTWETPSDTNTTYSAGVGLGLSGTQFYCAVPRISSGGNANTQLSVNTYKIEEMHNGASNLPTAAWYYILNMKGSDNNYQAQLALGETVDAAYYRSYRSGTWGSWRSIINTDSNTTYAQVTTAAIGLCPKLNNNAGYYLNGTGNWTVPPNTNTTYGTNVGCYGTLSGTTLTLNTRNFRV